MPAGASTPCTGRRAAINDCRPSLLPSQSARSGTQDRAGFLAGKGEGCQEQQQPASTAIRRRGRRAGRGLISSLLLAHEFQLLDYPTEC